MSPTLYKVDIVEAILESVAMIVVAIETGEILFASRPAEEMFGYQIRGELVGLNVDVLVPNGLRGGHAKHRAAFAAKPVKRAMGKGGELHGERRCGETFPVEIALAPIVISGQKTVVATVMDMSERKK